MSATHLRVSSLYECQLNLLALNTIQYNTNRISSGPPAVDRGRITLSDRNNQFWSSNCSELKKIQVALEKSTRSEPETIY